MQEAAPKIDEPVIKSKNEFPVVGVGASAGGLAAFKKFIGAIPKDSGMAFVLVQHLDPNHESLLPELLQRVSRIPVLEITDDIKVAPNNIYIIPSNKILLANDGVLELSPRPGPEKNKRNLPIDLFFSSLASVHQSHSLGVVLTGSGNDGTEGLKAIKNKGGTTFAQDEASSEWEDMPRNAVEAGVVDFILPPEEIPEKIIEITSHLHENGEKKAGNSHQDKEGFRQILAVLRIRKDTDFTFYKQSTIQRRILRRMVINRYKKPITYLAYLRENTNEQDELYQDMLIPVTSFFRDPEIFDKLCESILPTFAQKKEVKHIRLWVAGCSTGQEAYSLAICLMEYLNEHPRLFKIRGTSTKEDIQIFASDISEPAIAIARKGAYTKNEVEGVSPERLKKFFTKYNGGYRINKEVRELCVFALHNFLKDPPFGNMDLISCRNVLIYFQPYLQKKALSTFHYALNDKGYLLLGKSETTGSTPDNFTSVRKSDKLFIRNEAPRKFMFSFSKQNDQAMRLGFERNTSIEKRRVDFQKVADELLLGNYTPASVVVDESLDIVLFRGNTEDYLGQQGGTPSHNLTKMAKGGLAFELRNLLHQVKKSNATVVKEQILFHMKGNSQLISIEAVPLPNLEEPHYLILFYPHVTPSNSARKKESGEKDEKDLRIEQLEKELLQTREDMRVITEDQEAANEELQSANEELLSGGEEMQTLNEELETSKEELQSTNEEITAVNQELIGLNELVTEQRNFSEEIIKTVRESLVVLDEDLTVIIANHAFYETFQSNEPETVGQSIFKLGNNQWDIPELRNLLESVLPEKESFVDFEMTHTFESIGNRTMLLNAREIKRENKSKKMTLLAIEDITARKQAEEKIAESIHRYHEMIYSSPSLIAILKGEDFVIIEANDAILKSWGKDKNAIGKPLMQALPELEGKGFDLHLLDVFKTGKSYNAHEIPVELIRGDRLETVYYSFVYQAQKDTKGQIIGVAIIANEVTEQAELHKKISESEARFHQLTDLVPELIINATVGGKVFFYNKGWTNYTGWSIKRIQKEGWEKLMHPEELSNVKKNWLEALKTGNDFEMELRILDNKGDYKWHISRVIPMKDDTGEIIMWIGAYTDIQKLKEEEKRKEDFLKIVSHELKTPITSIKGYTQILLSLLEDENNNPENFIHVKPSLERIDSQITRLTRLISEMLDVDRINENQLNFQLETFPLNELVQNTIDDIKYAYKHSLVDLQLEISCLVNADKDRIGQVLINFITNAIKYSPDDKNIEVRVFQTNVKMVSVSVKDYGIGIEKKDQQNIFKRFYRVSGKDEKTFTGFGIGLYLASEIIERHRGKIRVKSKKGNGSEFIFTLPINQNTTAESENDA